MVTTLFFVIMFAYIYLYRIQYISADYNLGDTYRYAVASLVIQFIAYLTLPIHLQLLWLAEKDYLRWISCICSVRLPCLLHRNSSSQSSR